MNRMETGFLDSERISNRAGPVRRAIRFPRYESFSARLARGEAARDDRRAADPPRYSFEYPRRERTTKRTFRLLFDPRNERLGSPLAGQCVPPGEAHTGPFKYNPRPAAPRARRRRNRDATRLVFAANSVGDILHP